MTRFPNLAYHQRDGEEVPEHINRTIRSELEIAGALIVPLKGPQFEFTEVPYSVVGVLSHRNSDFDEFCKFQSRHGASSHLETWEKYFEFVMVRRWYYWSVRGYVPLSVAKEIYANPVGKVSVRAGGDAGCVPPETQVEHCYVAGQEVVACYHIDNQEGLNLFAETVKKHNLIKGGM